MTTSREIVAEFEARIGWPRLPHRGAHAGIVDWSALDRLPGLDPADWVMHGRYLMSLAPEGALAQWTLNRGGTEFVSLDVFVSSVDYAAAQRRLVQVASETMMPSIPYEPLGLGLGEICVGLLADSQDTVLWSARNVCFRLMVNAASIDTLALVPRLDAIVTPVPFSALATRRPTFDDVKVGPTRVHIDDTIEVEATLGPAPAGADLRTEFRSPGTPLFLDDTTGTTARFGARRAGTTTIEVAVLDRTTMLSTVEIVAVEVVGP